MADPIKRKWKTSKGEERTAWVFAFTDASGKRHKEQFSTKRAADARRIEVEGQVSTGAFRSEAKKKTVADACELYLEAIKARHLRDANVSTTYLLTNQGEVFNYIAPELVSKLKPKGHDKTASRVTPFPASEAIGHFKLSQFTSGRVEEYKDRLIEAGVSVATTRRLLATLVRIFKRAISKEWIAINPAVGVTVEGSRKDDSKKKIVPPSKAEFSKLLEAAQAADEMFPGLYVKILFAARSGLRASEQWALRWSDLDLVNRSVSVSKRLDYHGAIAERTKSEAGTRDVPLDPEVVTALTEWKNRINRSDDNDIVFPDSRSGHSRHNNFLRREFDPLKRQAGLPDITWHALRHYAISIWISIAELRPKVVQTFAGHATLSVTMDRYGHMFPDEDYKIAIDRIAERNLME